MATAPVNTTALSSTSLRRAILGSAVFLLGVGCGGGSSGTGAFSGGVDEKRKISTFTEEDRADFCAHFEEFAKTYITPDFLCTFDGIIETSFTLGMESQNQTPASGEVGTSASDPRQLCLDTKANCLLDPDTNANANPKCTLAPLPELQACGATAGQLEQCYQESVALVKVLGTKFTCDSVFDPAAATELQVALSSVQSTPTCDALEKQCPTIFGDE